MFANEFGFVLCLIIILNLICVSSLTVLRVGDVWHASSEVALVRFFAGIWSLDE